jgi:hypothetical protein
MDIVTILHVKDIFDGRGWVVPRWVVVLSLLWCSACSGSPAQRSASATKATLASSYTAVIGHRVYYQPQQDAQWLPVE